MTIPLTTFVYLYIFYALTKIFKQIEKEGYKGLVTQHYLQLCNRTYFVQQLTFLKGRDEEKGVVITYR